MLWVLFLPNIREQHEKPNLIMPFELFGTFLTTFRSTKVYSTRDGTYHHLLYVEDCSCFRVALVHAGKVTEPSGLLCSVDDSTVLHVALPTYHPDGKVNDHLTT